MNLGLGECGIGGRRVGEVEIQPTTPSLTRIPD